MAAFKIFYDEAEHPLPQSLPGLQGGARLTTTYSAAGPDVWDGNAITHTLNTMASIVGELKPGRNFTFNGTGKDGGLVLMLKLSNDAAGPRIYTEPLPIPPAVYNECYKRNVLVRNLPKQEA